jgi:hypothetical protein
MLPTLASLLQSTHPDPNGVSQQAHSFLIHLPLPYQTTGFTLTNLFQNSYQNQSFNT